MAENVFTTAWKIYSGQYTPNFTKSGQVLWKKFKKWPKAFWCVFLVHSAYM